VSHLDKAIGVLQARAERQRPWTDPGRIYRITSPLFWIVRAAAAVVRVTRWVMATARRRLAAAIGAVALVVIGAIVSGWAGAFFAKLLSP
jgi:hypothetical protein